MKNKYLTRCLCITLISTMVMAGSFSAMASDEADLTASEVASAEVKAVDTTTAAAQSEVVPVAETSAESPVINQEPGSTGGSDESGSSGQEANQEPSDNKSDENGSASSEEDNSFDSEESVTPGPSETPSPSESPVPSETPTPSETPEPTETPDGELTPTPTPDGELTPTPEPSETPTPTPEEGLLPENVKEIVDGIQALSEVEITLDYELQVKSLRLKYDKLSAEEQALVSNYDLLLGYENIISELKAAADEDKTDEFGDGSEITDGTGIQTIDVKVGEPVYYTNMVSNIHAGKEFYLDTLKSEYQLTFSEDFASVMDSIEKDYKKKYKLEDASDSRTDGVTTSEDTFLVRNWQDIIAVYIYEKSKEGAASFTLDSSCKEELAAIFEEMNPVVRDKEHITNVSYGNRHINYYIKKNEISREDRQILKKYVETDCKLLCATVTAAKGFVRQSVGDDVSEERVNVIAAAYSLVGKVGYFWGGKSTVFGDDPSWGTAERVTSAGSNSTGTVRAYGLDCSGFVTWAVVNGYHDQSMQSAVGDGTSEQWVNAQVVSEQDAQPGDLVFQRGPEAGSDNHVGILCGKTDSGDWIAVHCSSSKNGVTVGEAYSASFRYIRQPSFYSGDSSYDTNYWDSIAAGQNSVKVGNALQNIIKENSFTSPEETEEKNILTDMADVELFIGE